MFWTECKQVKSDGVRDYLSDYWNLMDITMIALYSTSYLIQFFISYYRRPLKGECIANITVELNLLFKND